MLEGPVLHVLVVGFHHKKGCQVEYAYPLLADAADGIELPEAWKHLPSLALPDGAHNYEQDTIYFHLPSLSNARQTVYGISCYRQMNAEKLLNRSSDITRGSVQKSVCVLSTLPLYGLIKAKLELITHAYFDERDFSKVSLLEETYKNLNSSLSKDMVGGTQGFLGLNVRDVILHFKHKAVLLFKLLLLERKVLFSKSPVEELCDVILSICSLFPGMIERGLVEAACSATAKHSIPELIVSNEDDDYLEVHYTKNSNETELVNICTKSSTTSTDNSSDKTSECHEVELAGNVRTSIKNAEPDNVSMISNASDSTSGVNTKHDDEETAMWHVTFEEEDKLLDEIDAVLCTSSAGDMTNEKTMHNVNVSNSSSVITIDSTVKHLQNACKQEQKTSDQATTEVQSHNDGIYVRPDTENDGDSTVSHSDIVSCAQKSIISSHLDIETDDCGFPLAVFTKGSLCHPYLSLPYLDLLSDVNTRSFVVGATNILFKQKKYLFDVIVEIDEAKVDIIDDVLKNHLHLTTEDLRFADHIVRHVMEDTQDVFLDGTGWEGGDEWLRAQFKVYLMSLLRTSELEAESKECEAFNTSFMSAWKTTHNYKMWSSEKHPGIFEINPGHPFHGQISVSDMRLRIFHTMQGSERGRKLNQVVASTGKVVSQTGKAVGGAFTTAKSAVSSWWSNLGTSSQLQDHSSTGNIETFPENSN